MSHFSKRRRSPFRRQRGYLLIMLMLVLPIVAGVGV